MAPYSPVSVGDYSVAASNSDGAFAHETRSESMDNFSLAELADVFRLPGLDVIEVQANLGDRVTGNFTSLARNQCCMIKRNVDSRIDQNLIMYIFKNSRRNAQIREKRLNYD